MLYISKRSKSNIVDVCVFKLDSTDNIDKEILFSEIFFVIMLANICNGKFYHRPVIFILPKPGLAISTTLVFSTDDDFYKFLEKLRYYFNFKKRLDNSNLFLASASTISFSKVCE